MGRSFIGTLIGMAATGALVASSACSDDSAGAGGHGASDSASTGGTGGTGGVGGGGAGGPSGPGGAGGCSGSGGCVAMSEACDDDADVASCLKPLTSGYCGVEANAEMWVVTASDCEDVPDGHYYFSRRQAGAAPGGCPGWDSCVVGAYALSPPYPHMDGAGGASPPGEPEWTLGGGEQCAGHPVACQGLPFGIVDDAHPAGDPGCSYQCTAADRSATTGTASCTGPSSETCSFTYAWESLMPWPASR